MKSIIISIQPRWCHWISRGIKTLEIRKTKPKLETPFKCYVYCTKNKDAYDRLDIHSPDGTFHKGNGKIIGEFVCDKIEEVGVLKFPLCKYVTLNSVVDMSFTQKSCLEISEVEEYLNEKTGYAWHISELLLYNEPKDLEELGAKKAPQSWQYIERRN